MLMQNRIARFVEQSAEQNRTLTIGQMKQNLWDFLETEVVRARAEISYQQQTAGEETAGIRSRRDIESAIRYYLALADLADDCNDNQDYLAAMETAAVLKWALNVDDVDTQLIDADVKDFVAEFEAVR